VLFVLGVREKKGRRKERRKEKKEKEKKNIKKFPNLKISKKIKDNL
jgi:hypothetical protein